MDTKDKSASQIKEIPVYRHSAEYAIQHGEIEAYRDSFKANMDCRDAIEKAIGDNYRDNRLDSKNISVQLGQNFGMERVNYVLANTIRCKDHDGRISDGNKKWAATVPVAEDRSEWGDNRNLRFIVDRTNPGLVDLLVNQVRKDLTKEQEAGEKKPSVLEKLQKSRAAISGAEPPKKHKEAVL
ncbi:MAG: DUF3849 domain-containing protein [Christensenellales bacterium]|jgi:hypothetical protein